MEIIYGCKYSKVRSPAAEISKQEKVNIPTRAWRSVKRMASRFVRRRKKLVVAVIVRRAVVFWGCLQAKRKVCRINNSDATRRGDEQGNGNDIKYDIFSYSKNFDDGEWQQEEVEFYSRRSFSYRFVQGSSSSSSLDLDCF